jgi:hypothetical protein
VNVIIQTHISLEASPANARVAPGPAAGHVVSLSPILSNQNAENGKTATGVEAVSDNFDGIDRAEH